MSPRTLILCVLLSLPSARAAAPAATPALAQGRFDNSEQVARETASDAASAVPRVTVVIEPTPRAGWTLWHVHIETDPASTFDQTWAMQERREHDGSGALVPYYQLHQDSPPRAGVFDPSEWLSLEACALRGAFDKPRIEAMSEGEPCVAVSMGVGARRALLPVGFVREGDWLRLDMNLRGQRTRIDAHRR